MRRYSRDRFIDLRQRPLHRHYEYTPGIRRMSHDYVRLGSYRPSPRWGPPKRSDRLSRGDLQQIKDMPRSVHLRELPTDVTETELKSWCNRVIDSRREEIEGSVDQLEVPAKSVVECVSLLKGSHRRWMANITLRDHQTRELLKEGAKSVKLRDEVPPLDVSPHNSTPRCFGGCN